MTSTLAGAYFWRFTPPDSPTSVGDVQLQVEPDGRYALNWRTLQDTPAERDWRAEWGCLEGQVTATEAGTLTFRVERGQRQVRSSAWAGRGVEAFLPVEVFQGTWTGDTVEVVYPGTLSLRRGVPRPLERGLILPDYAWG